LFDKEKMTKLIPNAIQRDTIPLRANDISLIPKVLPPPMKPAESTGKISAAPSHTASAAERKEKNSMLSDYFS